MYVIVNIRDQLHGFLWLCFSCWMMDIAYHRPMIRTSPARVGRVHCVISHDRRVPHAPGVHTAAGAPGVLAPGGRESRWPVVFPRPATTPRRGTFSGPGKEEATQPRVGVGQGHLKSRAWCWAPSPLCLRLSGVHSSCDDDRHKPVHT